MPCSVRISAILLILIATVGCDSSIPGMAGDQIASPEPLIQAATLTTPRLTATQSPSDTPIPTIAPPSLTPTETLTPEPAFPVVAGEIIYRQGNMLKAIGADGQHDRVLMPLGENGRPAALSPDSRYLGLLDGSVPSILDLETGEQYTVDTDSGNVMQIAWSPDSQTMFFTSYGNVQALQKVSVPTVSPAEVVTPIFTISDTIQREFVGMVDDAHVLLHEWNYRTSGPNGSDLRMILLNWQTGTEDVFNSGAYMVRSISADGTRVLLGHSDETNCAGAGTLRAFYTADLSITDGQTNIQRVITDDMEHLFGTTPLFLPDNQTIFASRWRQYSDETLPWRFTAVLLTPRGDGTYAERYIVPPDNNPVVGGAAWNPSSTMLVYVQVEGQPPRSSIWLAPLDGSPARFLTDGTLPSSSAHSRLIPVYRDFLVAG